MTSPSERISKQVIVMRKDLGMCKGKMVAQGAHASLGAVLLIQEDDRKTIGCVYSDDVYTAYEDWIDGTFTKICVGVDSETQLMQVYKDAIQAGLPVKLITDAGHTEFHGQPTRTCLAIGPAWSDDIDKITGGLTLL
jgi:peptidyl-tRNA hydrolase, PTH2 family